MRADDSEERFVQGQIDDLSPATAQRVPPVEGEHRRRDAVEPCGHVRYRDRWKQGRRVGESVNRAESGSRFDERAEAGSVPVRPLLAPPRNADDDEPRIHFMERFGGESPGLQLTGEEIFGENIRLRRQLSQNFLAGGGGYFFPFRTNSAA